MVVIKGHIATIGYDDGDPFSLVEWAARAGKAGYTCKVESEFSIALVTPEDAAIISEYNDDAWVCADGDTEGCEYEVAIIPISDYEKVNGDIRATIIE